MDDGGGSLLGRAWGGGTTHIGLAPTGADRVDADRAFHQSELLGPGDGEHVERGFRGAVAGADVVAELASGRSALAERAEARADIHHAGVGPRGGQQGDESLGDPLRPGHIGEQGEADGGWVHRHGIGIARGIDAGVVDEDLQAIDLSFQAFGGIGDGFEPGHIQCEGADVTLDQRGGLLSRFQMAGGEIDGVTLGGELAGAFEA